MKNKTIQLIILLVIISAVIYSYFSLQDKSNKERFYFSSYSEMDSKNLYWIPSFIPKDAYDIYATTSLDPSFIMIEFKYKNEPAWIPKKLELQSNYNDIIEYRHWHLKNFDNTSIYHSQNEDLAISFDQKYVWYSVRY